MQHPALEELVNAQGFTRKPVVKVLAKIMDRTILPDENIQHILVTLKGLAVTTDRAIHYTNSGRTESIPFSSVNSFARKSREFTFVGSGNSVTIDMGRKKGGLPDFKKTDEYIMATRQLVGK